MVVLGISQSPFYQLNVALRRLDPPPRLFLKGMEDINGLAKAHGTLRLLWSIVYIE